MVPNFIYSTTAIHFKAMQRKKTGRKYINKITDHFFCAFTFHTMNIYYYYNETKGSFTIKSPICYSNKKADRLCAGGNKWE